MDSKTEVPSEVTETKNSEEMNKQAEKLTDAVAKMTLAALEKMEKGNYHLVAGLETTVRNGMVTAVNTSGESMELFDGLILPPDASFFWRIEDGPVMVDASAVLEDGSAVELKPVNGDMRAVMLKGREATAEEAIFVVFSEMLALAAMAVYGDDEAEEGEEDDKEKRKKVGGRAKGTGNRPKLGNMKMAMDPITRAFSKAPEDTEFDREIYFDDNRFAEIKATGKGVVKVSPKAPDDMNINGPAREYLIAYRDMFWLAPFHALAATTEPTDGKIRITGDMLLSQIGYQNPLGRGCSSVMEEAKDHYAKLCSSCVVIDVTEERRREAKDKKRDAESIILDEYEEAEIHESLKAEPYIAAASFTVDWKKVTEETDKKDANGETVTIEKTVVSNFAIEIPETKNWYDLLPIARFAIERDMLVDIPREWFEIKSVKATIELRQALAYLIDKVESKTLGNKILASTMFRVLDFEPPEVSAVTIRKDKETGEEIKRLRTPEEMEAARKRAETEREQRIAEGLVKVLHEKSGGKLMGIDKNGKPIYEYPRMIEGYDVEWRKPDGKKPRGLISITVHPLRKTAKTNKRK